jgi:hypothetical protein
MEKRELRRADFVTSLALILFSIWMFFETFQMPMKDTFGGVHNVWYVSPALFPLIISTFLLIFGTTLLLYSIKEGGAQYFLNTIRSCFSKYQGISEKGIRFIAILVALFSFVYVNVPRIDFFITVFLFLNFCITIFYFDDSPLLRKLTLFYFLGTIFFVIVFLTDISQKLNSFYLYTMDLLNLFFLLSYVFYSWILIRYNGFFKKKFFITLGVAIGFPIFICPIFRYFLLVPLPYEGMITEIMHTIYYAIK